MSASVDTISPDDSLTAIELVADNTAPVVEAPTEATAAPARGNRLVSGSMWTLFGYGTSQSLRLVGNVIVSRLVLPESFGIMALVNVFLQGLVMFSDVGIEPSIIQHRRGDEPAFRNTAWTLQIIRGVILFFVAILLAWPLSEIYDEPRLLTILPIAAIGALIAGFNSTALFTVRRHLQLARLTLLDLTAQSIGLTAMCLWAWFSPGVGALVAGSLIIALVTAIGSHFLIRETRNRWYWEREAFHELFHFGKWIILSTLILFCAGQSDRLLLGKLVSLDQLGVYSVGIAIATLPNLLIGMLAGAVLYPLLARHARTSRNDLQEPFLAARGVLLHVGWMLALGTIIVAPRFFGWLYDSRYHDAAMIAQLMAVAVWINVLSITAERALPAIGDTRGMAQFNLAKLLAIVPASLVGFYLGHLHGFILGSAIGALLAHGTLLWRLHGHGLSLVRQDLRFSASLAIAAGVTLYGGTCLQTFLSCADLILLTIILGGVLYRTWAALQGMSRYEGSPK